jgi:hypothetical protein
MALSSPPLPSISYLIYEVYRYIANHPLVINPPVYNILTKEQIKIDTYRLFLNGIALDEGLTCSIFPLYKDGEAPPEPTTTAASSLFKPYHLSNTYDEVTYHIVVKLSYPYLSINTELKEPYYTEVPLEAPHNNTQTLLTSLARKSNKVYISIGIDIISQFLEVIRLCVEDITHKSRFGPFSIKSMEPVYINIHATPWQTGDSVYFQTGELLLKINAFISRQWRDTNCIIKDVVLTTENE